MSYNKLFLTCIALFVLVCLLFVNSVFASSLMWSQKYGSEKNEITHWLIETSDNGYVIGGYTRDFNEGEENKDFLLIKTDEMGNIPEFTSIIIVPFLIFGSLIFMIIRKHLSKKGGLA